MADTLGTKPLQIDELLRVVTQLAQQPQDALTGATANVAATNAAQPVRPEQEQVDPLSRLQTLLQGLASAGSTFAGGINRNVQPQNFGQNILDIRQEQVDRLNEAEALKFEDEKEKGLRNLTLAIEEQREAQRQADRSQDRIDAFSVREQAGLTRAREQAADRAFTTERDRIAFENQKELLRLRDREDEIDRKSVGEVIEAANAAFSGFTGTINGQDVDIPPMSAVIQAGLETGKSLPQVREEMLAEFIREEVDPRVLNRSDRELAIAEWTKRFSDSLSNVTDPTGPPAPDPGSDPEARAAKRREREERIQLIDQGRLPVGQEALSAAFPVRRGSSSQ